MSHSNTAYQSKDQNAVIKNIPYNEHHNKD